MCMYMYTCIYLYIYMYGNTFARGSSFFFENDYLGWSCVVAQLVEHQNRAWASSVLFFSLLCFE